MKNINRFFIDPDNFDSETPVIDGSDVNHIAKVLRMAPGQVVEILDGNGRGAQASILAINNKEVALKIVDYFSPGGEPPVKITLVQGLSKGDKMEYVVQKATELGVTDIIPMICHRSVVRLEGVKAVQRQERWQRVALEAAKQCRRAIIPKVHEIQYISEILEKIPAGTLAFLPWEQEKNFGLGEILKGDKNERIYIF
ncbi:MAG: 16S rRNA (uracil(1498)-N(3))-methyltransferase, partial [Peptococcaceae bacterium]|nr:16S rRNA (uracil(1498)-N(3))-methyltransferase [Peptococcaceae bacterium]